MNLSIVIPTLNRLDTASFLGSRIRQLLPALTLEVICVVPRGLVSATANYAGTSIVEEEGTGVYAAYAQGIRAATGQYVWLLGDDDYPLDATVSISEILLSNRADLVVCPVLFSSGKLYKPRRTLFFLILRNWCQQGVIYRREIFERYFFHRRFKIQADHYLNILLRAERSLNKTYLTQPICVFGIAGISSRIKDERFRQLRPLLARRVLGTVGYAIFWLTVLPASAIKRSFSKWH